MKKQISNCCNADVRTFQGKNICYSCDTVCQTHTEEDTIEEITTEQIVDLIKDKDFSSLLSDIIKFHSDKINEIIKHINKKK